MAKNEWIAASEVGRAAYCQKALELKYAGADVSTRAQAARQRGDAAHEAWNSEIKQAADKRCFVASHLYGIDDPRTECLRQFRDRYLMQRASTRLLVQCYYRLSPTLVTLCRRFPIVDTPIRWLCAQIVAKLGGGLNTQVDRKEA